MTVFQVARFTRASGSNVGLERHPRNHFPTRDDRMARELKAYLMAKNVGCAPGCAAPGSGALLNAVLGWFPVEGDDTKFAFAGMAGSREFL